MYISEGDGSVRIAICDDENSLREGLRAALDASELLPGNSEVVELSNGVDLLACHKARPFDIIFLDIEMEGISGIEAGHEIRSIDTNVIIIFITSHHQYVYSSFKIEAFDFIVKPFDRERVNDALSRALKKHNEQHHIIDFKWQGCVHALDISEIIYIEAYHRLIIFVTKGDKQECIGKLDEYECDLSSYGFMRCHQNALINMRYVKSIEDTSITTTYGHTVKMSARRKQSCLRMFNTYLMKYRV